MNKGRFFALGEDGEPHEIGEIKEMETFLPDTMNEQLEKTNMAWKHVEEQITLVIENMRNLIDVLHDSIPKYMQTELKFPKKKKRGTMRRRRRERRLNETD